MITIEQRIAGSLLGCLVGDALGVPYAFQPRSNLPAADAIDYQAPATFARAHAETPPGTWSEDGAQALCLLASLLDCGHLNLDDLARRLIQWRRRGYMAVGGRVFSSGRQTDRAIRRLARGIPPLDAGPAGVNDNGNGSLMRVLPLALWHGGTDAQLVADAQAQSRLTHGHPRAQVCCALYCLWARRTLEAADDPWASATTTLRVIVRAPAYGAHRRELEEQVRSDAPIPPLGRGYVLDTLHSARWAVAQGGYETVVKAAIGVGFDTDTTAAVAGGIAGLRDGIEAIPLRWREQLRGQGLVQPLLERLLRHQTTT